ncbi:MULTISPECIES: hypothetical protein [unclassified Ensifer]|uniref:hypothetical protein n=1 Tax=unclassified Ensifer TaxID=2633371 RepID=UPI00070C7207|nr:MULTISPECIES: hypothetical protein [unclassified Ensifer]KQU90392.1 hypothetical protein ASD00_03170 [Ensifer sp. Root31]KQW50550.1 hypothetical protein ASD02_11615 [Ensifer sp. Root1252]KQY63318.1 hypothetical protein ASD52_14095 [Ensifer sp. Root142]KRC74773.1 hypothetical protein ASE32_07700 [Ensifer sp. Root231]KRC94860.1 hypothetical protein ASE47_08690 [Ensifer sp. Root258]
MRMLDGPKAKNRTADRKVRVADVCLPVIGISRNAACIPAANILPDERSNRGALYHNGALWTVHGGALQGSIPP